MSLIPPARSNVFPARVVPAGRALRLGRRPRREGVTPVAPPPLCPWRRRHRAVVPHAVDKTGQSALTQAL